MNARTKDTLERLEFSQERKDLIKLRRLIVKPAISASQCFKGKKIVEYTKLGHAPITQAIEPNNWGLESTVRKKEKKSAADLQLLMTETTNDPKLLNTLVCLKRQQHKASTKKVVNEL